MSPTALRVSRSARDPPRYEILRPSFLPPRRQIYISSTWRTRWSAARMRRLRAIQIKYRGRGKYICCTQPTHRDASGYARRTHGERHGEGRKSSVEFITSECRFFRATSAVRFVAPQVCRRREEQMISWFLNGDSGSVGLRGWIGEVWNSLEMFEDVWRCLEMFGEVWWWVLKYVRSRRF